MVTLARQTSSWADAHEQKPSRASRHRKETACFACSDLTLARMGKVLLSFLKTKTAVIFLVFFRPCNSSYLLRDVLPVKQASVPLQHVWCSSGNCSLSFPFRSPCTAVHHILQNTCRLFCFGFFFFSYISFYFYFFSSVFSLSGLFCQILFCSRTRYASTSFALPW